MKSSHLELHLHSKKTFIIQPNRNGNKLIAKGAISGSDPELNRPGVDAPTLPRCYGGFR
jgi:hypothetical protein